MSKFCFSRNEEEFEGDFDTREDAAAEAFEIYPDHDYVWVGEVRDPTEWIRPVWIGELLYEQLAEALMEEVGEAEENFKLTDAEQKELGEVVLKWIAEHGGFKCFGVKDIRQTINPTPPEKRQ